MFTNEFLSQSLVKQIKILVLCGFQDLFLNTPSKL